MPTGAPDEPAWLHLSHFPVDGAIEISSIVVTDGGFVAVGYEPAAGEDFFGRRQGVIWRSSDGRSWQRAVEPAFANATPLGMAAIGSDLYVVGLVSDCPLIFEEACEDGPTAGNAVWRSSDGTTWQRLAVPTSLADGLADGVAVGGGRLAIHGGRGDEFESTIWMTSDGIEWAEQTDLAGPDPISVLHGAESGFVAFGTRYDPTHDEVELVASFSGDGLSFEPASLPERQSAAIESVASDGQRHVAVGYGESSAGGGLAAMTLTSLDGRHWAPSPVQPELERTGFHRVIAVPGGFVAIGFMPEADDSIRELGLAWWSADGTGWRPLGPLVGGAYTQLNGVASDGRVIVAVAVDFEEGSGDDGFSTVHVWVAELAALSVP